jgi:hypothetical protein
MKHRALSIALATLSACSLSMGCGALPFPSGSRDAGASGVEPDAWHDPFNWTVATDAGTTITNVVYPIPRAPKVDLLFVLDNSPAMAANRQKLAAQLPRMITDLNAYCSGAKLDLRLAIITSDMGTGGISSIGSCGPRADGSLRGDQGRFQFLNAAACGVTDTRQPWLFENRNVSPKQSNFSGDIGTVFGCLLSGIGTSGCGFSQPLAALEAAFYDPANVAVQRERFLRPGAYFSIVIITDQDDCSAWAGDGIFADSPSTAGETPRLRCTTRATTCNGQNLSTSPPGYPAETSFAANLADCATRTDFCRPGVDVTNSTDCNPLLDYRAIAEEIKQLKTDGGDSISVFSIFGWPLDDAQLATAKLIIDRTPNPDTADTAHPELFDAWPICYDPDHPPASPASGLDREAAAHGAGGGLRVSAFLDEFSYGGMKSSLCQPDLSAALKDVFPICIDSYSTTCVQQNLVDSDLTQPGVQASCEVWNSVPAPGSPKGPYTDTLPYPPCDDAHSVVPCWRLVKDTTRCPWNGQKIDVVREPDATFNEGTRVNLQCLTCPEPTFDTPDPVPGCGYKL